MGKTGVVEPADRETGGQQPSPADASSEPILHEAEQQRQPKREGHHEEPRAPDEEDIAGEHEGNPQDECQRGPKPGRPGRRKRRRKARQKVHRRRDIQRVILAAKTPTRYPIGDDGGRVEYAYAGHAHQLARIEVGEFALENRAAALQDLRQHAGKAVVLDEVAGFDPFENGKCRRHGRQPQDHPGPRPGWPALPVRRRPAECLQNQSFQGPDRFQPQKQIESDDRRQQRQQCVGTGRGDEPRIEHAPPRSGPTVFRREAKSLGGFLGVMDRPDRQPDIAADHQDAPRRAAAKGPAAESSAGQFGSLFPSFRFRTVGFDHGSSRKTAAVIPNRSAAVS